MNNLFWKAIWVTCYLITAIFTFSGKMMTAMYWMAGTMLTEAVVSIIYYFLGTTKNK